MFLFYIDLSFIFLLLLRKLFILDFKANKIKVSFILINSASKKTFILFRLIQIFYLYLFFHYSQSAYTFHYILPFFNLNENISSQCYKLKDIFVVKNKRFFYEFYFLQLDISFYFWHTFLFHRIYILYFLFYKSFVFILLRQLFKILHCKVNKKKMAFILITSASKEVFYFFCIDIQIFSL